LRIALASKSRKRWLVALLRSEGGELSLMDATLAASRCPGTPAEAVLLRSRVPPEDGSGKPRWGGALLSRGTCIQTSASRRIELRAASEKLRRHKGGRMRRAGPPRRVLRHTPSGARAWAGTRRDSAENKKAPSRSPARALARGRIDTSRAFFLPHGIEGRVFRHTGVGVNSADQRAPPWA
jgi:hypothetical protein